jgi:hypothetical protein
MDELSDSDLLRLAREQFAESESAEADARREAKEDIRIYEGIGIWDGRLRAAREGDPKGARPCLTISDLPPRVRQITNDVRQNKPSIKIRPVDSNADVDTAEVLDGIIRHIEQQSMSDIAYETANFYQTVCGYGYFRLIEGYSPEQSDRELYIRPLQNPFAVFGDPYGLCPVGSDWRYCFIVDSMPLKQFEEEYGKSDITGWNEGDGSDNWNQWVNDDYVRIAEWMRIEHRESVFVSTQSGEYPEDDYQPDFGEIMDTRNEKRTVCVWRKIVGNKVLKEIELPISYIPVFRVPGEMLLMDGKLVFKGLVRDSRDAVRMVSYNFSAYIESVTTQSKAPYIGVVGQFDGLEDRWANANIENMPYIEYNAVDINGQPAPAPSRQAPPMASQGLIQGLVLSQQAMKDVTGMGAASLGQKGNETSGKAILARQKEGDVSTYHYPDNLGKAMRHLGRVLVQWIPKVYSEKRVSRIVGEDGETDTAYLDSNQPESVRKVQDENGKIRKIYNLGVGSYDVVTTVGASYSTKRVEMAEMMEQFFQAYPPAAQLLGDIYIGSQDMPGAERMARRLKAILPPQVAAADGEDDQEMPSPEVQAQMQQLEAHVQEGAALVQQLQQQNDQLQAELQSKQAETDAKVHATNMSLDQEKIKGATAIQVAEINAESREKIAGLQHQVNRMQQMLDLFMAQSQKAEADTQRTDSL